MGMERPPVVFYAFDLLQLNGKDLKTLPIEERKAKLAELLISNWSTALFDQLHQRH
jgi:bifunctional non-homologous end joining protein LigD